MSCIINIDEISENNDTQKTGKFLKNAAFNSFIK